ncbi:MAG: hypothetical protein LBL74_06935 [Bacteroidales bacterium]|jgi:hypothetical protein|nr:hypothetical protein [Bacteroidales bacterium]
MKQDKSIKIKFRQFIFQKQQLSDLIIIAAICLLGYIAIKYFYPYPWTMSDSGGYVICAMDNAWSFYRPFGYSKFLQILHAISPTISFLTLVQMLLYLVSTSIFALTVKFFFTPNRKWLWYSLLCFLSFSPLAFYMINSIMSDLLFCTLIYFILTGFLFIVNRNWTGVIIFSLALYFSLHVRYSAIIFPFLFIPFLFFIKGNIRWVSILASLAISFIFYNQIKSNMKETMNLNQFSTGFDGWQYANNAMHIVPFIDVKPEEIKDEQIRGLHKFILQYNDSILARTKNGTGVSARFIWENTLPLKKYMFLTMQQNYLTYPHAWVNLGSGLYKDYGKYLMIHYPFAFMRYYLLPNMVNIVHPNFWVEYKNIEIKEIKEWYNIDEKKDLSCRANIYDSFLYNLISISHIFIWIGIIIVSIIAIIKRKRIKFNKNERIAFWALFCFGAIYYASTVFASPIELRYWLPMAAIQFAFCYILLNKLSVKTQTK